MSAQVLPATPHFWVICLCADWCGLCRDYRAVLEDVAQRFSSSRFVWLDIEDQADWVGYMDIETFPTLLVADAAGVLFLGPLAPHAETLARLLTSLQEPGARRSAHSTESHKLLAALPDLSEFWITI